MSISKRRTNAQRARAERQRQRNDNAIIERIAQNEIKNTTAAGKQPLSESKPPGSPVDAPAAKLNLYQRMLAKINAANAAREK
jgi:hypothetical protein